MKNTVLVSLLMAVAALCLSLTACDDQPDSTTYPNPATITQGPNGLAFPGKVTIKSSDPYTDAQWNDIVENVITAFNAAYTNALGPSKGQFATVFANDAGAQIVLVNNLANNWEVKDGEFKTLYLNTGSIATATYGTAIQRMAGSTPSTGNAAPAKHRVFLANSAPARAAEFV